MNEILTRKYIKKVMSYGVTKYIANDIVQTAIETGKGKHIEMYIEYAMTLVYGLKVKANVK
jgi:hypothetical protein